MPEMRETVACYRKDHGIQAVRFTVEDVVGATGGRLLRGRRGAGFSGISIDSRTIAPGELFWALRGERFDGNDFITDALLKGAAGIVTDDSSRCDAAVGDVPFIAVPSSLPALQDLASFNRGRHPVPLVAVTGSNGKTTTKEILASILAGRYEVLKNEGNLNNLIGVPLTLLKLHGDHEVAVVEMGMNARGEIRELARMARPDFGVVTNIGEAHLENLGSMENIKRAKGELVEMMEDEDTVILNADDEAVMDLGRFAKGDLVTFGITKAATVRASEVEIERDKGTLFMLSTGDSSIPVLFPLYGIHQLYDALAASAAALALGLDLHEIREGLEEYSPFPGRMEIVTEGDVTIIDDSYNANPSSMRYALKTMVSLASGRKVAVLGDMLETGKSWEALHAGIGEFACASGVDLLVTVGSMAARYGDGARVAGMKEEFIHSFSVVAEAVEYLKREITAGDWILVKGSRGMGMEKIVAALVDDLKTGGGEEG